MKFVFKEVSQNNDKQVALFRSEDQSCELFVTGSNLADFFQRYAVGQSFITITPTEEEPASPTSPSPEEKV